MPDQRPIHLGILVRHVAFRALVVGEMGVGQIEHQADQVGDAFGRLPVAGFGGQHAEKRHQERPLLRQGPAPAQLGVERVHRPAGVVDQGVELRLVPAVGRQAFAQQVDQAFRRGTDVDDADERQPTEAGTEHQPQIIGVHRGRFPAAGPGEIQLVPGPLLAGAGLVGIQLAVAGAIEQRAAPPRRGGPKQRQGHQHLGQRRDVAGRDMQRRQARHRGRPRLDRVPAVLADGAGAPGLQVGRQLRGARPQRLGVGAAAAGGLGGIDPTGQRHLRAHAQPAPVDKLAHRPDRLVDQLVLVAGEIQQAADRPLGQQPRLGAARQPDQQPPRQPLAAHPLEQPFEALHFGQLREIDVERLVKSVADLHRPVIHDPQVARNQLRAQRRQPAGARIVSAVRMFAGPGKPAGQERLPVVGGPVRIDPPAQLAAGPLHRQ